MVKSRCDTILNFPKKHLNYLNYLNHLELSRSHSFHWYTQDNFFLYLGTFILTKLNFLCGLAELYD